MDESRINKGESPEERRCRHDTDNATYKKRAKFGWKHPKDRRGPLGRVFDKFKKGPFDGSLGKALKRDVGMTTKMSEGLTFKEWLRLEEDA